MSYNINNVINHDRLRSYIIDIVTHAVAIVKRLQFKICNKLIGLVSYRLLKTYISDALR